MSSTTGANRSSPVRQPSAALFDSPGPFVSVYLATPGALPHAAEEVALRWRNVRRELNDADAPPEALAAIEPLTRDAHTKGQALAVIADAKGVRYAAHLPEPPARELSLLGPLPHLVPLLATTQRFVSHVVVATDRLGAELIVVQPDDVDVRSEVEGEDVHINRTQPGGWSQRRFQQRAENQWESNAGQVAEALTELVDRYSPELVIVSGDVRAVQLLRDQVPQRVGELLIEVSGEHGSVEEVEERAREIIAARADTRANELLDAYQRERGQNDRATSGVTDTLSALSRGQAGTVFLDPTRSADRTAWFGPSLSQVAATQEQMAVEGVPHPRSGPLADVIIRAALGTGATVHITAPGTAQLGAEGVGALLRYS